MAYRRIARTTDTRTWIGSLVSDLPAGDSIFYLVTNPHKPTSSLNLASILDSFVYDWQLRNRLGGTNLSWFVLEETVATSKRKSTESKLDLLALRLIGITSRYSLEWQFQKGLVEHLVCQTWQSLWALTPYERLRLRCVLDAVVAELYGLGIEDFSWILKDCDHPISQACDNTFARTLEPKGFWRTDKEKDPELRHTVLSLIAFHDLKRLGIDAFLALNNGEGWMLPKTLRLADYGLGHDDRAKEPQPVAARLGDRFLPWQLEGTPEESWAECERHAENLRLLLGEPASLGGNVSEAADNTYATNVAKVVPDIEQLGLF